MEINAKTILLGLIILITIIGLVATSGCIVGSPSTPHTCGKCSNCLSPCPCPKTSHTCENYCNRYCPG